MMYYEDEIDRVARGCIRMLKHATQERYYQAEDFNGPDGEGAAIFGATLAALCQQVAPGYTSKQGEWWNVAQPLLADALRACDTSGYPDWQAGGVAMLREYVRDHQLDGEWPDEGEARPDQHQHLVGGEVIAFPLRGPTADRCTMSGCEG